MSGDDTVFHCPGANPTAGQGKESSLPEVKALLPTRERGALMESDEERCPPGPARMLMSVAAVPEAQTTNLCNRCTVIMTFLEMLGTAQPQMTIRYM